MTATKKPAAGLYTTLLSAALAIVGLIIYVVNCNTNYFRSTGTNLLVIGCLAAGIVLAVTLVLLAPRGITIPADLCQVAVPVLLIIGLIQFVALRVNAIAAIMTFTNNAQNMSDLSSALLSMGILLAAFIVAVIAAFLPTVSK